VVPHAIMAGDAVPIAKIFSQLGFFVSFAITSEIARLFIRRHWGVHCVAVQVLRVSSLVLCWYSASITLVLYNKWVLVHLRGNGLPFPIFYSMTHMAFKGVFASLYLVCSRRCRGSLIRIKLKNLIVACLVGVMTGLDVAASNLSFLFISVAFYTMLKSASLIFMLVLATAARLERCSLQMVSTIMVISSGILLTSYGEARFDVMGLSLVILAEIFAAIRWIATQVILEDGSLDAITTVFYMSPASTVSLVPFVLACERGQLAELSNFADIVKYLLIVIIPSFLAFLLLLVEVQLVKETSSLTLAVFGNLKSIITILFSISVFGERTALLQWCGLALSLCGMLAYSCVKNGSVSRNTLTRMVHEMLPEFVRQLWERLSQWMSLSWPWPWAGPEWYEMHQAPFVRQDRENDDAVHHDGEDARTLQPLGGTGVYHDMPRLAVALDVPTTLQMPQLVACRAGRTLQLSSPIVQEELPEEEYLTDENSLEEGASSSVDAGVQAN